MRVRHLFVALALLVVSVCLASFGCSRDPKPSAPPKAAPTSDTIADGVDASAALPSSLQALHHSPADGLYVVDAIIVEVEVCHCPPNAQCDCPPDALNLTNDAADSMAWSIPVVGLYDIEARFIKGARVRLLVRVKQGDLRIVGVLAKS